MAYRTRKLKASALNITLHPHSPEKYVELFTQAAKQRKAYKYQSNQFATISNVRPLRDGKPLEGIYGDLFRFTDIDKDEPWLDLSSHKAADPDIVRQEVSIPDNLKPNLTTTHFVFFPKSHTFLFLTRTPEGKTFGPTVVQRIFSGLLNSDVLQAKFGEVDVTIEPTKESVERIFQIRHLTKLDISLTRPNPDDLEEEAEKILRKLNRQNAKRLEQTLTAANKDGLSLDEDVKILARVAASNGQVEADGYNAEGIKVHEATDEHPWEETFQYDTRTSIGRDVFHAIATELLQAVRSRFS